jgi:hypothetical protein
MTGIVKPTSQELFPVPSFHVNYVFNTSDTIEEYRTSRYLNRIINIFGQDCVIRGLDISSIEITTNDLLVNINKGVLIQDSTVINILNNFDKSITGLSAATQINSDYIIVIYTSFQFQSPITIPITNPNTFSINIGILNSSTNIIYSGDPATAPQVSWNTDLYRTIIYAANITDLESMLNTITIGSNVYNIRSNLEGSLVFNGYNDLLLFSVDGGIIE